jgi:predicted aspartyl protease
MPTFAYPFIKFGPEDIARPYLPVVISNPISGKFINTYALIDTGADESALPALYASALGHNLTAGIEKRVNTGNGFTLAYSHTSNIEMIGFSTGSVVIDYLPNLPTPLLGFKSFLSQFILIINYPENFFSLEFPD